MKSTFLAFTFVLLQAILWSGTNGIRGINALNQRIRLEKKNHAQLLQSVQRLQRHVDNFKKQPIHSSSLTEDHMRWQLGLIKKGEWFCRW